MNTLMQASHNWATRPADQRFTSLTAMLAHSQAQRAGTTAKVLSSRALTAQPRGDDNHGMQVVGINGEAALPTHWAFGQLAQRAGAPAGYLRELPSPIAADCLNYGLWIARDVEEVGALVYQNGGAPELRAVTGPNYGRIWNADILGALVNRYGDGVSGQFRVPGEFGQRVEVTKDNTTLFASDRDMFVFLADEERRIEVPNRRDGKPGSLARGFFVWNSEVGKCSYGLAMFLFDYVCCNRIVWGVDEFVEIRGRHTASAPDRWLEEVAPAISAYAEASAKPIETKLIAAQQHKLDKVDEFLRNRFTNGQAFAMAKLHEAEEGRPIETAFDAVTAITAYARSRPYQDERIELEREAGKVLALAA